MAAIGHNQFLEINMDGVRWSEIRVECGESADFLGNVFDLRDGAEGFGATRNYELIEGINGVDYFAVDGLTDLLDFNFFIKRNLDRRSGRDGEVDGSVGRKSRPGCRSGRRRGTSGERLRVKKTAGDRQREDRV